VAEEGVSASLTGSRTPHPSNVREPSAPRGDGPTRREPDGPRPQPAAGTCWSHARAAPRRVRSRREESSDALLAPAGRGRPPSRSARPRRGCQPARRKPANGTRPVAVSDRLGVRHRGRARLGLGADVATRPGHPDATEPEGAAAATKRRHGGAEIRRLTSSAQGHRQPARRRAEAQAPPPNQDQEPFLACRPRAKVGGATGPGTSPPLQGGVPAGADAKDGGLCCTGARWSMR
jgi:hypothetical protein